MALGLQVAQDIASAVLKNYARSKALMQTMQDRPLLRFLNANKKTFPGGNQYVSDAVQGAVMNDTAGFFVGYSEDDTLSFAQAANLLRAEYQWFEVHAGLIITWTELKKDGITIVDSNKKSEHADMAFTRLTSLLENRMDDYGESWARAVNLMLWRDGSQDAKQVPGVRSLLTETPAVGVTGGLNRATYSWWRNRTNLNIAASAQNQTLSKKLRSEQRQLRRFQGKPNKFLAGSQFIDALELEVSEKGLYTMEGFVNKGQNDMGMSDIAMRGVGVFEYDPTMDDEGLGKYCFEFDSRRVVLRPMEGEDNKVTNAARPYQYMVFLESMTWTGTLHSTQLNCHEIFSVA